MQISQDRRGVARTERHAEAIKKSMNPPFRKMAAPRPSARPDVQNGKQEHAENLGSPRGRLAGPRGDPCIIMRMLAAAPADPRGDPYILIPLPATAPADPRGDPYILMQVAAAAPADPRGDPYILINQGRPGSWNVHGSMDNRRTPTLTLAPVVDNRRYNRRLLTSSPLSVLLRRLLDVFFL